MKRLSATILIFCFLTTTAESAPSQVNETTRFSESARQSQDVLSASLRDIRHIQKKNEAVLLSESRFMDANRARVTPAQKAAVAREANYILEAQFNDASNFFAGAINNVYGDPTWIVPRENALAILALIQASEILKNPSYRAQAELAADFLVRAQDSDGGWFDSYDWRNSPDHPESALSKSPTQTAEVMMAFDKLGFTATRYEAMKKGADFLISLQDADDGLIVGGIESDGITRHTWKWASDNSFAYLALKDAAAWAKKVGDRTLAKTYNQAAEQILQGINNVLYVTDPSSEDYGVWHRVVDADGVPQQTEYREWINYAPQMLDLPAVGVGSPLVGEWIHEHLQLASGAVVWAHGAESLNADRQSPGFSFQAALVWLDLGQTSYANAAIDWTYSSGLLQTTPDQNGITGGWVDWYSGTEGRAPEWQRFIDTSFYAASTALGGYNFRS